MNGNKKCARPVLNRVSKTGHASTYLFPYWLFFVVDIECNPACVNGGTCTFSGCLCLEGYIGQTCDRIGELGKDKQPNMLVNMFLKITGQ